MVVDVANCLWIILRGELLVKYPMYVDRRIDPLYVNASRSMVVREPWPLGTGACTQACVAETAILEADLSGSIRQNSELRVEDKVRKAGWVLSNQTTPGQQRGQASSIIENLTTVHAFQQEIVTVHAANK